RLSVDERLALEQRDVLGRSECDDGIRVEVAQGCGSDVRFRAADDRELAPRRKVEIERTERPAERLRRAREQVANEAQGSHRLPLELLVAPDPREPQEDEG